MLIGHEEARWQNLMTVDDCFEDLAVQIKTLVLNLGISGR